MWIARKGKQMHRPTVFWVKTLKEGKCLEKLVMNGRTLKFILVNRVG
jgi:hypothetical protein